VSVKTGSAPQRPERMNMTAEFCIVQTTTSSQDNLHHLANILFEAKLAACIHTFPIRSLYRWEEKIHDEPEFVLQIKAKTTDFDDICRLIKAHHVYEVPEIVQLNLAGGDPDYLDWIRASTRQS
jgi:periplasmic divalent cation tolerance protein